MHEHSVSTCQVRNVLGTGIKNEEDKIPSSQSLRSEAGLDTKAQNKVDMGCCGSRAETLDPAGIPREDVLRGVLGAKESCQCRPWTKAREVWSHMSQVQRYRCWILLQLNMQRGGAMWGETMSSTRGVPRAHSQLPAHRSCGFLLHLRHWTCFLCHGDSGDLSYRNTDTDFHKSHKNSSSLKKKRQWSLIQQLHLDLLGFDILGHHKELLSWLSLSRLHATFLHVQVLVPDQED